MKKTCHNCGEPGEMIPFCIVSSVRGMKRLETYLASRR